MTDASDPRSDRPDPPPRRPVDFDPALSRFLDGRSPPEEAGAVEARIAAEAAFAAEVAARRADGDALRAIASRARPAPDLADRVVAALAREPHASDRARFDRLAKACAAAAAAILVVGLVGAVLRRPVPPGVTADFAADDAASLTRLVESRRLAREVDAALDGQPVAGR